MSIELSQRMIELERRVVKLEMQVRDLLKPAVPVAPVRETLKVKRA